MEDGVVRESVVSMREDDDDDEDKSGVDKLVVKVEDVAAALLLSPVWGCGCCWCCWEGGGCCKLIGTI